MYCVLSWIFFVLRQQAFILSPTAFWKCFYCFLKSFLQCHHLPLMMLGYILFPTMSLFSLYQRHKKILLLVFQESSWTMIFLQTRCVTAALASTQFVFVCEDASVQSLSQLYCSPYRFLECPGSCAGIRCEFIVPPDSFLLQKSDF